MADAVVIGAGPNGLVGANKLADAGWDVVVLEAQPEPGGAVRSGELTLPGHVHDRFSAVYPLGFSSPHIRALELERQGLRWLRPPVMVADPAPDGTVALISSDFEETIASVEAFAPGDGAAWRELTAWWERIGPPFLDALLDPFPPVRGGAQLVGATDEERDEEAQPQYVAGVEVLRVARRKEEVVQPRERAERRTDGEPRRQRVARQLGGASEADRRGRQQTHHDDLQRQHDGVADDARPRSGVWRQVRRDRLR